MSVWPEQKLKGNSAVELEIFKEKNRTAVKHSKTIAKPEDQPKGKYQEGNEVHLKMIKLAYKMFLGYF